MQIETLETCPTCYGMRYSLMGSTSFGFTEDGRVMVSENEDRLCPTCKGYGVVLVVTEVPKDITVIEGNIKYNGWK